MPLSRRRIEDKRAIPARKAQIYTTLAPDPETQVKTLRNYIDGSWVDAVGEGTLDDRNPATGELAARVPLSGATDIDAAARAAAQAQPAWRAVPVQRRARVVIALRDALVANRRRLAELVTADLGKTTADAEGEVGRGIESVESAIAAPHLLKGENLEGVAMGLDASASQLRSPGFRSPAGRTRSTATSTPTASMQSTSTPARRL